MGNSTCGPKKKNYDRCTSDKTKLKHTALHLSLCSQASVKHNRCQQIRGSVLAGANRRLMYIVSGSPRAVNDCRACTLGWLQTHGEWLARCRSAGALRRTGAASRHTTANTDKDLKASSLACCHTLRVHIPPPGPQVPVALFTFKGKEQILIHNVYVCV